MTDRIDNDVPASTDDVAGVSGSEVEISRGKRIMQSIGAIVVTIAALYFVFGIPAYLLFGMFFD